MTRRLLKRSLFIIFFLVLFFSFSAHASEAGHLKYFGYFGDGEAAADSYKDYANVVWLYSNQYNTGICGVSPGNDITCQIEAAVAHGQKVILRLGTYLFFDNKPAGYSTLCDHQIVQSCINDYTENWNSYKQYIKPYVDNGSIIALYVFDEPVLYYGDPDLVARGVYDTMYEKLDTVTKLIKKDFPNLPLATTLLPSDVMKLTFENIPPQVQKSNGEYISSFQEPLSIPSGFDWLGFDCYSDWNNCYHSGVSITQLHDALKGKISSTQKLFLVPDGFQYVDENNNYLYGGINSLLGRIDNYYQLAKNDSAVVAVFPWKWNGDGAGHLYAKDIPLVAAKYEAIGREIINPVVSSVPIISSFTATPDILSLGQSSVLAWSATSSSSFSIDQGVGSVSGISKTVTPAQTTTYTLTASNTQGSATKTLTITVASVSQPRVDIKADNQDGPITIDYNGRATISWSSSNVSSCTATGGVSGTAGSYSTGSLTASRTYTVSCSSSSANVSDNVLVSVGSQATVSFKEGSLLNDKGTIYIIENGKKKGFTNFKAFSGLGYNLNNAIQADTSNILEAGVITSANQRHTRGVLILDKGAVYYLGQDLRYPFPSEEVFRSWDNDFKDVVKANSFDLALTLGPVAEIKK